jgi:hypothetical protein
MAISVANDPPNQPNVDPIDRIKYEELLKIIDIHLRDFTALPSSGSNSRVEVVTRVDWAHRTIADWEKYAKMFQQQVEIGDGSTSESQEVPANLDQDANFSQMIQNLSKMVGPSMIAMQLGSMVGHLAKVAFGSYEIPVPRITNTVPMIIAYNVDQFAKEGAAARPGQTLGDTSRVSYVFDNFLQIGFRKNRIPNYPPYPSIKYQSQRRSKPTRSA